MAHVVQYIINLRDQMSNGISRIAGNVTQLGTRVRNAQQNVDRIGRSIDGIGSRINTLMARRNASTSLREIRSLNVEIRRLRNEANRLENIPPPSFLQRIREGSGAFGALAKSAAAGFGAMKMFEGLKGAAKLAMDAEQAQVSFNVMLGSADKAKTMLDSIYKQAKVTPYSGNDLIKNAQTMLQFGVSDKDVLGNLNMIGDVAMGDKNRFAGLTLAFSQMRATGRLVGQDLLQMVNQGFNPLMEISNMTGKSIAVLKKEMESGAISADMVSAAFKNATSEGGRFFQMSEKQSETTAGKMAVLLGNIQDKAKEFGNSMLPAINKGLDYINQLVLNIDRIILPIKVVGTGIKTVTKFLKENQGAQMALIAVLGIYKLSMIASAAATKGMTLSMQLHHYWTVLCTKATRIFNATIVKNPIGAIAVGLVTVVGLLVTLRKRTNEANKGFREMQTIASGFAASEVANLDRIFAKMRQTEPASQQRIALVQQLKTEYPELNRQLEKELTTTNNLAPAYDALVAAAHRRAKVRALESITTEMMENIYKENDVIRKEVEDILFSGSLKNKYHIPAGADRSYIRQMAERAAKEDKGGNLAGLGRRILTVKSTEDRLLAYNNQLAGLTDPQTTPQPTPLIPNFNSSTNGLADNIQGGKGIKNFNINVEALIKENNNHFDNSQQADPEVFMDKLKQALMMVLNDVNYASL